MDEKKSQQTQNHCPYFSPVNADKIVNLLGGSYLFSFCHTKEIYFYLYKAAATTRREATEKKFN